MPEGVRSMEGLGVGVQTARLPLKVRWEARESEAGYCASASPKSWCAMCDNSNWLEPR